jgi:hypothetical protein
LSRTVFPQLPQAEASLHGLSRLKHDMVLVAP